MLLLGVVVGVVACWIGEEEEMLSRRMVVKTCRAVDGHTRTATWKPDEIEGVAGEMPPPTPGRDGGRSAEDDARERVEGDGEPRSLYSSPSMNS